jgi:hypothetical protein
MFRGSLIRTALRPQNDHNRAEAGNAEDAPAANRRKIARRQRRPFFGGIAREIAHLDLHEDHGHLRKKRLAIRPWLRRGHQRNGPVKPL